MILTSNTPQDNADTLKLDALRDFYNVNVADDFQSFFSEKQEIVILAVDGRTLKSNNLEFCRQNKTVVLEDNIDPATKRPISLRMSEIRSYQ